jgi:hypothetical protein
VKTESHASASSDSTTTQLFSKLAKQMGLKDPKLKANEYEVRIWNRQALRYGDAHMVYVLRKNRKGLTVVKYLINSNQQGFQFAESLKPTVTVTLNLWERLVRKHILTLPDQSIVFKKLYAEPEPRKDTVRGRMEPDGSFTIKGQKTLRKKGIFSDGEGYSFEVFSVDSYRAYNYSNPRSYIEYEPQSKELQDVVGILDDLSLVYRADELGRERAKAINKD